MYLPAASGTNTIPPPLVPAAGVGVGAGPAGVIGADVARQLGYTRMWSIHPDQIRVIVDAFAPSVAEVDVAVEILRAAHAAGSTLLRSRARLVYC